MKCFYYCFIFLNIISNIGLTQISSKFYDQFESERKIIIENNLLYEAHLERLNRNLVK